MTTIREAQDNPPPIVQPWVGLILYEIAQAHARGEDPGHEDNFYDVIRAAETQVLVPAHVRLWILTTAQDGNLAEILDLPMPDDAQTETVESAVRDSVADIVYGPARAECERLWPDAVQTRTEFVVCDLDGNEITRTPFLAAPQVQALGHALNDGPVTIERVDVE